jgi:hypothetical protein
MKISNLLIATVLLIALASPALSDYPMFGLDPGRTGNASGDAPLAHNAAGCIRRTWVVLLGPIRW